MKLTTTRLLAGLFVLTAIGVTAGLLALHERERPEDPRARPVGPSSIIRGVRKRSAEELAQQRRDKALAFERSLHPDAGATDAASW